MRFKKCTFWRIGKSGKFDPEATKGKVAALEAPKIFKI